MSRFERGDRELVQAIRDELQCLRVGPSPLPRVLALTHQLLAGEFAWSMRPVRTLTGWHVEDTASHRDEDPLLERFARCISAIDDEYAWFNPSAPDRKQRNRVVDSLTAVRRERPGYLESSRLYRECLHPAGIHEHHQLRVLLCDGGQLLAWFGVFQRQEPTQRQHGLLAALVPMLRKRLSLERTLGTTSRRRAALHASIEAIPQPAFVVGRHGRIDLANEIGRAVLADEGHAIRDALARHQHGRDAFVLPDGTQLAILHDVVSMRARVDGAALRLQLTARQTSVLRLVVEGHANATIAELLGIGERAVEHHMTALFARTSTTSRAALVAAVAWEGMR